MRKPEIEKAGSGAKNCHFLSPQPILPRCTLPPPPLKKNRYSLDDEKFLA